MGEEDSVCEVCLEGDWTDSNKILFCEGDSCGGVAVHQFCYGVPAIPRGEWLCDLCKSHRMGKPLTGPCVICKSANQGGTLKPVAPKSQECFHISCALAVAELELGKKGTLSDLRGLENLDMAKHTAKCDFCQQTTGYTLRCQFDDCNARFHPRCGLRNKARIQLSNESSEFQECYCPKHKSNSHQPHNKMKRPWTHPSTGRVTNAIDGENEELWQNLELHFKEANAGAAKAFSTAVTKMRYEFNCLKVCQGESCKFATKHHSRRKCACDQGAKAVMQDIASWKTYYNNLPEESATGCSSVEMKFGFKDDDGNLEQPNNATASIGNPSTNFLLRTTQRRVANAKPAVNMERLRIRNNMVLNLLDRKLQGFAMKFNQLKRPHDLSVTTEIVLNQFLNIVHERHQYNMLPFGDIVTWSQLDECKRNLSVVSQNEVFTLIRKLLSSAMENVLETVMAIDSAEKFEPKEPSAAQKLVLLDSKVNRAESSSINDELQAELWNLKRKLELQQAKNRIDISRIKQNIEVKSAVAIKDDKKLKEVEELMLKYCSVYHEFPFDVPLFRKQNKKKKGRVVTKYKSDPPDSPEYTVKPSVSSTRRRRRTRKIEDEDEDYDLDDRPMKKYVTTRMKQKYQRRQKPFIGPLRLTFMRVGRRHYDLQAIDPIPISKNNIVMRMDTDYEEE